MITLTIDAKKFTLNDEDTVYLAETLNLAVRRKALPTEKHRSVTFRTLAVENHGASSRQNGYFRSHPDRSDHVLTDC
ncbi:hypothetical protein O1V64_08415 [Rouxiella badensis]|uniref:Uncharacterized protein n=1 Tax=Rouxiella badensis TaxID=1646377 RepID=A0A1X0W9C3_9GAMM|nr:hypothetical protein [Rouxiella badensis]ORJ23351.1 hypothetical protein BS640_21825 [Rouxiella badensis]WAT06102.1 hypothetical protein O1V64_08415 [Rouxiella badensis]